MADDDMGRRALRNHQSESQTDRWDTGLSAGNVTDSKGRTRPNRILRQRLNQGLGVYGSDSYVEGKAARTGSDTEDEN
jgi:hypothetical protein